MRNKLDEQLELLNNELTKMGFLIEEAIKSAVSALIEKNPEFAHKTLEVEREINQMEKDIETICLKLLLRQQPVASDLRTISTALKIITDMERIGDQASDIAKIVLECIYGKSTIKLKNIPYMARAAIKMVNDSVQAFVDKDLQLAMSVKSYDDEMDDLFEKVKYDIIEVLKTQGHDELAVEYLLIAKYFERIGDHAENIADWVVFSITGQHVAES